MGKSLITNAYFEIISPYGKYQELLERFHKSKLSNFVGIYNTSSTSTSIPGM
jgi:hypothetical protein